MPSSLRHFGMCNSDKSRAVCAYHLVIEFILALFLWGIETEWAQTGIL